MAKKPSIPKGTRDFSPGEMARRNYIFDTIKKVFTSYGFQPIETPAMENLTTLLGKYGDEGDKLLFKILNSGDFISKVSDHAIEAKDTNKIALEIAEKGLRYDLTVPFARYVVQHQNDISFPFKRYQIQPVWRADRPQKGRYREFYQCDVDVIGSNSLLNEAEFVCIINDVFKILNIKTIIKINNRKILAGIAETIGEKERITEITVAIDKLDKIGLEKVNAEMLEKGISKAAIDKLQPILKLQGNTKEKLNQIESVIGNTESGAKGIAEMRVLFSYIENFELNTEVELDLTLARGLNYYTGAIFEVKAKEINIGSICGGGRYDDLTGIFGLPGVSGVGVSFGAERIYDVMEQLSLFPDNVVETTHVLFVNFGEKEEAYCLPWVFRLRMQGLNVEIFPENAKMKKQLSYANKKKIPFVILAGTTEMAEGRFTVKNMESGEQRTLTGEELYNFVS